jgi:all-trans-retinol dehydrogenase (NAD+)
MKIKNMRAVVTGGAMGIGLATAKRLAREGCRITLWDKDEEALAKAAKELGPVPFFGYTCDVTDRDRVFVLADRANRDMGGVDILVNNAGFLAGGNFLDRPVEDWVKTMDVNLNALLYTTYAFLPGMYQRDSGHIVNISSAAGTLGVPGLAVYSASKWAVWGLTESLRHEAWNLGKRGVRFSSIHPSFVATGLFAGAKIAGLGGIIVPRIKDHDSVAAAVVESALKKGRYSPKRPRSVRIAVFFRGLLPDFIFQRVVRLLGVHHGMSTWKGRDHGKT